MDRRVGNGEKQRAVIGFHLDQRAARHDAGFPPDRQHVLRLHFDLPVAAASARNAVDELLLRFALAVRVDVAQVVGEQRVETARRRRPLRESVPAPARESPRLSLPPLLSPLYR